MAAVIVVCLSSPSESSTPSRKTLNTRQLFIAVKKTFRSSFLFSNFESTYFGWMISLLTQGLIRNSVEIWIGKLDANLPPLNFHFSAVKSDKTEASAPLPQLASEGSFLPLQFFNSEFHRKHFYVQICFHCHVSRVQQNFQIFSKSAVFMANSCGSIQARIDKTHFYWIRQNG